MGMKGIYFMNKNYVKKGVHQLFEEQDSTQNNLLLQYLIDY